MTKLPPLLDPSKDVYGHTLMCVAQKAVCPH